MDNSENQFRRGIRYGWGRMYYPGCFDKKERSSFWYKDTGNKPVSRSVARETARLAIEEYSRPMALIQLAMALVAVAMAIVGVAGLAP